MPLPCDGLLLSQHDPDQFRTRQILVEVKNGQLNWQPTGPEISFPQMQRLRAQGCAMPADVDNFSATLANLGVSVRLEVTIAGQHYLLLVPQLGPQGEYLKLVSGYVPCEQLDAPLSTVLEEISQELLLFDKAGRTYRFSYQGQPVATPYPLEYGDTLKLTGSKSPPQWYLHPASNSLQLVWHLQVELPRLPTLALYTEENYNTARHLLETRLSWQQAITLLPLSSPPPRDLALSEYFTYYPL